MSEMERQKGIIKRLSTEDNINEVYQKLVDTGEITDEWTEFYPDGKLAYIDSDKYDIINGCLFDVSEAPSECDSDEEIAEATRLNDTDYQVHVYWYNGGDCPIDEAIKKADEEYVERQIFYAIKVNDYGWVTGAGNSYLKTPRLYFTEENARNAIERHWPGFVKKGYKIVKLKVVND